MLLCFLIIIIIIIIFYFSAGEYLFVIIIPLGGKLIRHVWIDNLLYFLGM